MSILERLKRLKGKPAIEYVFDRRFMHREVFKATLFRAGVVDAADIADCCLEPPERWEGIAEYYGNKDK